MSAEPLAYLNGQFLPQSQARLPLHDAGFVLGATVTDLCRTFAHRPYRLPDHLARFRASCAAALVPQPLADADLTRLAEQLLAHNAPLIAPEEELALVLFATPGPVGYYLGEPGGPGDGPPTIGLHTFPLPFARYRSLFQHGARLIIPPTRHVPASSVDPRIKQRSRLHWWLAERQARSIRPGTTALLLDDTGHVTETAASNFLLVQDGAVVSPPRSSILNGVSLLVVEELCRGLAIPFVERSIAPADCRRASEALLSSTPYCVAGVAEIDGQPIPWPGPVFRRLLDAWSGAVGVDIARQILSSR
jgi:branched-subunit amino acid aminotransferase/4-amino-4-deoxychorismate lyase